jgi:serine/threonine protein kinase
MLPLPQVRNELLVLAAVSHPNIVQLVQVHLNLQSGSIHVCMQLMAGGEVYQHVCEHGALTEVQAREVMCGLLSALVYLHALGIVHRDVKLENMLLVEPIVPKAPTLPNAAGAGQQQGAPPASPPQAPGPVQVKLADFGLARRLAQVRLY